MLASTSPIAFGELYTLEISVMGNRLTTSVNGKRVAEYLDEQQPFKSGGILLACRGDSTIQYKEISISEGPAEVGEARFVPLSNGKNLSGWTFPLGSEDDWTVAKDGSIQGLGTADASTMATVRSDFEDFHLRMEMRTSDKLNKLILIRALHAPEDVKYYVLFTGIVRARGQIASLGEYRFKSGGGATDGSTSTTDGLREVSAPKLPGLAMDSWQLVEIIAVGSVIRMRVDGREVSAFEDTESRLNRGQIAIRIPKAGAVQIRNIEIKELNTRVAGKESQMAADILRQASVVQSSSAKKLAFFPAEVWWGTWTISSNQVLVARNAGHSSVILTPIAKYENVMFEAEVKRVEGNGRIELGLGGDDEVSIAFGIEVKNNLTRAYLVFWDWRARSFLPARDPQWVGAVDNDKWDSLRMVTNAGSIKCYFNDKEIISAKAGGVRFRLTLTTIDAGARFRNLRVRDANGRVLLEGLPKLPVVEE